MKLKKPVPAIALAFFTFSTFMLNTDFPYYTHTSQAVAQTARPQRTDLKVAADEFVIALDDLRLNIPEATTLFNQGQQQQGLEIYKQELERQGQILTGDDKDKIEEIGFALVKLAALSEKLGFLRLSDSALSSAAQILKQATDGLSIFKFTVTRQEATYQENTSSSSTGFVWNSTWTSPRSSESSSVSYNTAIGLYVPHFNLLQQIYAAKGRLILAQQGSRATEQEQYYQSLLASEVVRTLSVDQSIAGQLRLGDSDFTKLARAFSARVTVEDIKRVARAENATIVSYSIISEKDNARTAVKDALVEDWARRGLAVNKGPSKRLSLPDKLLTWVVKPTGEITFVERQIPSELVRNVSGLISLPGSDQCERDTTSDECRGQSSTAIAKLVRSARAVIGVKVRGQQGTAIARLVRSGSPDSNAQNNSANSEQLNQQNEALKQLYKLLIEPIESNLPLNEQSRVVFIPQGSLSFVPFAALKDSAGQYLIEKHTIQTAPNFRTLLLANLNREQRTSDNKDVLIVGDPTMPKLQGTGSVSLQLEDLPNAKKEAESVSELFKRNGYKPNLLVDNQATESRVTDRMRKAKVIHLATHGILDAESETSDRPTSSQNSSAWMEPILRAYFPARPTGAVVLASSGSGTNENGFLTSDEIFQMKLKADLVILSACNTGRGPLTPGGVVGLPFSLSIAGVPSIIVSLWAVPDDSTAQLMTKFYEYYLANPNDKAQAMRQAMLYMMRNGYQDSPLDWAAFTLVGTSN